MDRNWYFFRRKAEGPVDGGGVGGEGGGGGGGWCFFFFQAEDGIRYDLVTGVQTCALPICMYSFPLQWKAGYTYIHTG